MNQDMQQLLDVLLPELVAMKTEIIGTLRAEMAQGFARVDDRFAKVDERFARGDERFASMDARFDKLEAGQAESNRLTAVEFAKVHGELHAIKRAMATKQEVSRLRLEMNARFDAFAEEIEEVRLLRSDQSAEYNQQQGQLNDHERRLSRLEEKRS